VFGELVFFICLVVRYFFFGVKSTFFSNFLFFFFFVFFYFTPSSLCSSAFKEKSPFQFNNGFCLLTVRAVCSPDFGRHHFPSRIRFPPPCGNVPQLSNLDYMFPVPLLFSPTCPWGLPSATPQPPFFVSTFEFFFFFSQTAAWVFSE